MNPNYAHRKTLYFKILVQGKLKEPENKERTAPMFVL